MGLVIVLKFRIDNFMTYDGYKYYKESDEIVDVSDNVMITNEIGLANMA